MRFFKINKLIKSSIVLYFFNLIYLIIPFIKVRNNNFQQEINDHNIFKSNLSKWIIDSTLEPNVNLIIFLSLILTASILLVLGLIKYFKKNKFNN